MSKIKYGVVLCLLLLGVSVWSRNIQDHSESTFFQDEASEKNIELFYTHDPNLGLFDSNETVQKNYQWVYNDRTWKISFSIPSSILSYYEGLERTSTRDYSVYVTNPFDDEYLRLFINEFNIITGRERMNETQKTNLLINFVQSLTYTRDDISTPYDEYPRYPLETLMAGEGDCEDTSILMAALLSDMGFDVILINPPGHMAVGVNTKRTGHYWTHNNKDYYYLETIQPGWKIGECPEEYQVESYLYAISPRPVITHTWEAAWNNEKLDVIITVKNSGTFSATDLKVWMAVEFHDGTICPIQESDSFDIDFNQVIKQEMITDFPNNDCARLCVKILDQDGYYISESYSNWSETLVTN